MSTTLRWQDVAGQVRGPDYTDSAAMITRGIEGIGQSVSTLGGQGDARRKAIRDQENQVLALQAGFADRNAKTIGDFGKDVRAFDKEQDLKELSAVQSLIQAGARDAALQGISLPDFLASNKEYASLDAGARSYLGSMASDSYVRGDDARRAQAERDADNARQERQWNASFALQQQSAREASAARAEAAADRKQAREEALDLKDPFRHMSATNAQHMRKYASQAAPLFEAADLSKYKDKNVMDVLTKQIGLETSAWVGHDARSAASEISKGWRDANARLAAAGMDPLPEEAMTWAAASNKGDSSFFGTTEPSEALYELGVTRTRARAADLFLGKMVSTGNSGGEMGYNEDILNNLLRDVQPAKKKPAAQKPVAPLYRPY